MHTPLKKMYLNSTMSKWLFPGYLGKKQRHRTIFQSFICWNQHLYDVDHNIRHFLTHFCNSAKHRHFKNPSQREIGPWWPRGSGWHMGSYFLFWLPSKVLMIRLDLQWGDQIVCITYFRVGDSWKVIFERHSIDQSKLVGSRICNNLP